MKTQFTLIKKIAKHGNQAIIVIPKLIEGHLKPGTIVEVRIEIIENADHIFSQGIEKVIELSLEWFKKYL